MSKVSDPYSRANGLELYRQMIRVRLFEEEVARRFRNGELPGFYHLSVGQEAIPVGVCANLREGDFLTGTHRGHGHSIARGVDPRRIAAELYGSEEGICRGLGNTMHISDIDKGLVCGAIVGGLIPIATGVALAFATRRLTNVAVSFFGDGAANQGVFHESMNIAALWKLPVLYICENNGYGEMTPVRKATPVMNLSDHGKPYGISSVTIDGNDVEQVNQTTREAIERARRGEGPSLIECVTCRWRGAFEGDLQKYRPQGEVEEWMERDPIRIQGERIISRNEATKEDLDQITAEEEEAEAKVFLGLSNHSTLTREDLERVTYAEQL